MDRAKDHYIDEKPRFVSKPELSCLAITDYATYNSLDDLGKFKLLDGKTAGVVRNWPVAQDVKFDANGLRTVTACLTSPVGLQGECGVL